MFTFALNKQPTAQTGNGTTLCNDHQTLRLSRNLKYKIRMTLDILICSLNKGIVRIGDMLRPARENVRYIVSYQYTDDRYLELIPEELKQRTDVSVYKYRGQGLSANRNLALEKSTADLVMYADDDARFSDNSFDIIFNTFETHPEVDVAFFCASTYKGKALKSYPQEEQAITALPETYSISTIEMVFRRGKVKGAVRFDERFGLGTKFLTCGEEDVWLTDALRQGLNMRYFPKKIIETSTMLKRNLVYIDAGVQRSKGAFEYYLHGNKAWWKCFCFTLTSTRKGMCHFLPMMRHLAEGIRYMQRTK